MAEYFTNVAITDDFKNALASHEPIYGFNFIPVMSGGIQGSASQWMPFEFDHVKKLLKIRLGIFNINTIGGKITYSKQNSATEGQTIGITFDLSSNAVNSDVNNLIILDLSAFNITTSFYGRRGYSNSGSEESPGSLFIDEHYHITSDNTLTGHEIGDQYGHIEFITNIKEIGSEKLNNESEDTYITDNNGFYKGSDSLMYFTVDDGTAIDFPDFSGLDLEDVYQMNDYKVNLLGKTIKEGTVSGNQIYSLVINTPVEGPDRTLNYVNLPEYVVAHRLSVPEASDLNTVLNTGIYRINDQTLLNGPLSNTYRYTGVLEVQEYTDGARFQKLVIIADEVIETYTRYMDDSGFHEWINSITESNLTDYLTYDLIVKTQADADVYSANPDNFKSVAIVNGTFNFNFSNKTLASTVRIDGYNATMNLTSTVTSSCGTKLSNLDITYTANTGSGTVNLLTGFSGINECKITIIAGNTYTVNILNNCTNIQNVTFDTSDQAATITHMVNCSYIAGIQDLSSSRVPVLSSCTYIDGETVEGYTTNSDNLGGFDAQYYYISSILPEADVNTVTRLGLHHITGTLTNGPDGVSSPVVLENLAVFDGNTSSTGVQRIIASSGKVYSRVKINNTDWSNWVGIPVEDNAAYKYNIFVAKSDIRVSTSITNFASISVPLATNESMQFSSQNTAANGPVWVNNETITYGNIYRTNSGYIILATNGEETAIGKATSGSVNWKYLNDGVPGRPANRPLVTTYNNLYLMSNVGLVDSNSSGSLILETNTTTSAVIGIRGTIIGPNRIGTFYASNRYNGSNWESGTTYTDLYKSISNDLLKEARFFISGNRMNIEISINGSWPANSIIVVDFITNNIALTNVTPRVFIGSSPSSVGANSNVSFTADNGQGSSYNVTGAIGGTPIFSLFDRGSDGRPTRSQSNAAVETSEPSTSPMYVTVVNEYSSNPQTLKILRSFYLQNGRLYTNSINATSALEAKKDIHNSTLNAVDLLDKVNIVDYKFKEGDNSQKIGFIADYTDELLSTPNKDSMDISNCIGVLIKAIQEQSQEIKNLKKRLGD